MYVYICIVMYIHTYIYICISIMDCISYLKIPQLQGCFFEVPPASRSFLAKMLTKDPKMRSTAQVLLTDAYLSQARAALCHPPKPGLDGSEESEKI